MLNLQEEELRSLHDESRGLSAEMNVERKAITKDRHDHLYLVEDRMHHSQAYVADHFSVGSAHGEVMTSDRQARRRVVKKKKKKVRKSSTMVVKNSEEEVADATE